MVARLGVTIGPRVALSSFSVSPSPAPKCQSARPRAPQAHSQTPNWYGFQSSLLPVTLFLMPPQPLPHTSARVLEFDSLLELLRGYVSSPLGQRAIAALAPSGDRGWIQNQQQLTTEVREFRRIGGGFDF